MKPKYAIIDIETEEISDKGIAYLKNIWCIGVSLDGGPIKVFTKYYLEGSDGTLPQALALINTAEFVVAHNGSGFDIPVIELLLGSVIAEPLDTLLLAKIMFSKDQLFAIDASLGETYPKNLIGSYSLKAFGIRLNDKDSLKLEFEDWTKLSKEMMDYMVQDVVVCYKLLQFLLSHPSYPLPEVVKLEHDVRKIITQQEIFGFYIDIEKTRELNTTLLKDKMQLQHKLQKIFKPKMLKKGNIKSYKKASKIRKFLPDISYKGPW